MADSFYDEISEKKCMDECEIVMEDMIQRICSLKVHGRVRIAWIEEVYEQQGYRMGIPKKVYVSRVLERVRKKTVRR